MLENLFFPENVAVIGASRQPGKVGHDILANLVKDGFAGDIIPVNPAGGTLFDLKVYPSLREYPGTVDQAIVAVPKPHVLSTVKDALAKGARNVIMITAGFKETGSEGAELEAELTDLCRRNGARLVGPNCLGLLNTGNRLNSSFAGSLPRTGRIGVFSQSGALCTSILDLAEGRNLGLSKLISIGNKADINENHMLEYFAGDPDTDVIVGYLENIVAGDSFIKTATDTCSIKPVIILKSGTSKAGQKAAASHTGVLAGADTAYGAAFKRSGVIRADTFEALFDYATALSMQPLPKGDRVLIITNAGGPGTMAADAVEHAGMTVAELETNTATSLREKLPAAASVGNPVDVLGDAPPERYADALLAAQSDDSVDAVIVILTPQAMTDPRETARRIARSIDGSKPVLASFMGGKEVLPGRQELTAASLPDYESPERAVAALKVMYQYATWKNRPPRVVTRFRVNRRRASRIIGRNISNGIFQLNESKAKKILDAYGFNILPGRLITSAEEAMEYARGIGFPVAMKIVSQDIVHKSDMGGVKLHLATVQQVRDAFDLMMMRILQQVPNARIEGVYLEKMADPGLEIILGMSRDPQFGPMLMFGLGGIFVEVMKDVTFHLAPITQEEAIQMLKSTRSYGILEGKRGQKGVDIPAIATGLQRISQLTTDFPQITELDINPFIVGDIGTDPVVADARITLARPLENKRG
ncbi:acetate--CoA ligase family protein [Desulfoprunum benzoelyticum]|uniref:Acetyltransferase n=1 Tax=Desulfoprunum benzoelyticum TaxID=1506996 RepID=A0A840UR37_9BACT|nr:acetate--CoA ligase [Desulfoprunum benzoelyticum]MBB5348252.1 acetyltransferase [Desulfoprunum benzoelyticum]MBM9529556.1 acetate--CoA ligase family protein [Desulfoprunum benzoelyticum]